jgi:catechol 2,3-dioxygenase-like lactoylglutathione lyase family enzyme
MSVVGLDHVQVAAPRLPDTESKARDFYTGVLGLEEIEKPDVLKPKGGVWFSLGSGQLHVGIDEPFSPARKAHPAFLVSDLAALRRRIEDLGYATSEAETIPGVIRFYVYDPFGNRLELMERV